MSCFGSRFLLAKPAGCKVAGCAHPHPFAQVHRLMIEPDWLIKEPPAGSFLPSLPSKLRHRHPSSLTEVGWHEGSTERSPWRLAVLRKLWYYVWWTATRKMVRRSSRPCINGISYNSYYHIVSSHLTLANDRADCRIIIFRWMPDRMESKKYCPWCRRHTLHKETR